MQPGEVQQIVDALQHVTAELREISGALLVMASIPDDKRPKAKNGLGAEPAELNGKERG